MNLGSAGSLTKWRMSEDIDRQRVRITVLLGGWLKDYYDRETLSFEVVSKLEDALPEIRREMEKLARKPVPKGGAMMSIGGLSVRKLIECGYRLKHGDALSIVPLVAGG